MDERQQLGGRWYHQGWGVVVICIGVFVGLAVAAISAYTGYYFWQIKQGRGAALAEQFTGQFTFSGGAVQKPSAISRAELESADDPAQGAGQAPVTVVEFIDFKCPNCRAAAPILQQLLAQYGRRVRLIVRDFPVESTHPGATELAELAFCADQQGRYFPLHDILYDRQDTLPVPLTKAAVAELAAAVSLDAAKLEACRAGAAASQEVRADYFDAIRFGVRGTPTFFVNGDKVEGVIPWKGWVKFLAPK